MLGAAFSWLPSTPESPSRSSRLPPRHADPRTRTVYDRRGQDLDKHSGYVIVALVPVTGQPTACSARARFGRTWMHRVLGRSDIGAGCIRRIFRSRACRIEARPPTGTNNVIDFRFSWQDDSTVVTCATAGRVRVTTEQVAAGRVVVGLNPTTEARERIAI